MHAFAGAALLLTAAVGPARQAAAQEGTLDPEELGGLSLEELLALDMATATKTSVPLAKAPVAVKVITAEDIARSSARTFPDLLRRVAGVDVRWNPMVPVITMRGFGQLPFSSRVLFLIDGIPQNSALEGGSRPHPLPVLNDLQSIKRIEVIRGPGAALYGENAFWGVVNIVTFDGEDLRGGRAELSTGARDFRGAGLRWGQAFGEKGSLFASGRFTDTTFPTRFWRDDGSRAKVSDLLVKGKRGPWRLSYQRYDDNIDGFNIPLGANVLRAANPLEQTVDIGALSFDGKVLGGKVSLYGHLSQARRDGMFCGSCHAFGQQPAYAHRAGGERETFGELRASFAPVASHRLLVGVEGRQARAGRKELEMLSATAAGIDDFNYQKLAAYLQDEVSLAQDRVRITAGLRYDGKADDVFADELSPRLAVVWTATPRATLRASWGTAFRFPSFAERYQSSWWLGSGIL